MLTKTPNGLREIVATFGDLTPKDDNATFERRNIVLANLPKGYKLHYDKKIVTRFRCHRLLVDNFIAVFKDIQDSGLNHLVDDYGGIYQYRKIRGINAAHSTHSWGIAIDIEPADLPLGSSKRIDQRIVDIFKKYGFTYGGDFRGRKDPMHFQFASNY